jgi:hypothetical protein
MITSLSPLPTGSIIAVAVPKTLMDIKDLEACGAVASRNAVVTLFRKPR